jgi:hypothetical protein
MESLKYKRLLEKEFDSDGWVFSGGTSPPRFKFRFGMDVCIYLDLFEDYPALFFQW